MLRASSSAFVPQPVIQLDNFVHSLLLKMNHYYIKGGKAFNHFYPQEPIPTPDFDLVATNGVCNVLFDQLTHVMGKKIKIESYDEPILVTSFKEENLNYDDHGIIHQVRSFLINGINVIDVIITDADAFREEEMEIGENGLVYWAKPLFLTDLQLLLKDRQEKLQKPTKKSQKRVKRREKARKSEERVRISKKYGGQRTRNLISKYLGMCPCRNKVVTMATLNRKK